MRIVKGGKLKTGKNEEKDDGEANIRWGGGGAIIKGDGDGGSGKGGEIRDLDGGGWRTIRFGGVSGRGGGGNSGGPAASGGNGEYTVTVAGGGCDNNDGVGNCNCCSIAGGGGGSGDGDGGGRKDDKPGWTIVKSARNGAPNFGGSGDGAVSDGDSGEYNGKGSYTAAEDGEHGPGIGGGARTGWRRNTAVNGGGGGGHNDRSGGENVNKGPDPEGGPLGIEITGAFPLIPGKNLDAGSDAEENKLSKNGE